MAQECTENSVAVSSSTTPNWWYLHHASSIPSWTTNTSAWDQSNPSSNSSCEEDLSMSSASFTNASNHSGLTVESACQLVEPASSNELIGEHASDSQLWSHILLGVGSNDELNNSQDVGENLLEALSSKNTTSMSSGIFGSAACDYFKKTDQTNWEFTNPSSTFNNFEKPLNGSFSETLIGNGRLNKLSNFVSQLSIAPPNPEVNRQFDPLTCNISLSSSVNPRFSQHQNYSDSTPGFQPCYGHDLKVETEHHHGIDQVIPFRRPFNRNGVGFHIGLNNSMVGDQNGKYYYGMADATSILGTSAINWADSVNFSSRLNKTLIDIQVPKTGLKSVNLSDCKRQGLQTSSPAGKGNGTKNEGKKKRSTEENSETVVKKAKQEGSTVSSQKVQAPKVKISEKITVLQQIVSPFGRTDTASVLYEAIQYIKFLQEQVQLLSNPYMKTTNNSHKDPWGALDRKEKGDGKLDLRSRGLCLVPISCTPQLYHDNSTGSDYWTPTYRGCLYK